jgi:parallel beta-helix repeat protein
MNRTVRHVVTCLIAALLTLPLAAQSNRTPTRDARYTLDVAGLPSLTLFSGPRNAVGARVQPRQTVTYDSFVSSAGATATNLRVRYTLPEGGTFVSAFPFGSDQPCSVTPTEVICTRASLAYNENMRVALDVAAPERLTGGNVVLHAELTQDGADFNPADNVHESVTSLVRYLMVTNTKDEGSGSLRQALLESQTFCADAPCTVVFNIPGVAPGGFFDIHLKSALPEVRGFVKIDGTTQTAFSIGNDGNSSWVNLIGTEAGLAHGLLLGSGCELQVLGLTITGFTWPGIEAHRDASYEQRCWSRTEIFPNTLIAGNTISHNYRGVVVVDSDYTTVRDNLIANYVRSGVFVERGEYVNVTKNRVVDNGASGMFFNIGSRQPHYGNGADVTENIITGPIRKWSPANSEMVDDQFRNGHRPIPKWFATNS